MTGILTQAGLPFPVAAVAAILVGAIAGVINGFLVTVVGLPSLAVTIGTLALFRGSRSACSAPPRSPTSPSSGPTSPRTTSPARRSPAS